LRAKEFIIVSSNAMPRMSDNFRFPLIPHMITAEIPQHKFRENTNYSTFPISFAKAESVPVQNYVLLLIFRIMSQRSNELPKGESGPKRTTEEPIETAAANAEAVRLAEALGVASTSRRHSTFRRSNASPVASNASTPIARQKKGFGMRLFSQNSNSSSDDSKNYRAVASDGNTNAALNQPTRTTRSSVHSVYSPPTKIDYGLGDDDDDISVKTGTFSVRTSELAVFDSHGNRAPYREGPYDIHHDYYGRQIKRRWCK
jgi:hypothetical protein